MDTRSYVIYILYINNNNNQFPYFYCPAIENIKYIRYA